MLPVMIAIVVLSVAISAAGHLVGAWRMSPGFFGSILIAGVTYPYLKARRKNEEAILYSASVRPDDSAAQRWFYDVLAMFCSTFGSLASLLHSIVG